MNTKESKELQKEYYVKKGNDYKIITLLLVNCPSIEVFDAKGLFSIPMKHPMGTVMNYEFPCSHGVECKGLDNVCLLSYL